MRSCDGQRRSLLGRSDHNEDSRSFASWPQTGSPSPGRVGSWACIASTTTGGSNAPSRMRKSPRRTGRMLCSMLTAMIPSSATGCWLTKHAPEVR